MSANHWASRSRARNLSFDSLEALEPPLPISAGGGGGEGGGGADAVGLTSGLMVEHYPLGARPEVMVPIVRCNLPSMPGFLLASDGVGCAYLRSGG